MKRYCQLLILICSLFMTVAAHALTASFTATHLSGCAPLLDSFFNTTSPSAGTAYSWSFGPAGSSVLVNPSVSFTEPGTYVVTLTATNGTTTSTASITITVFPAPTPSFSISDTTVCVGTPVTFTNTSTSGVPGAMTCTWGFGDGSPTATGSPVSHTYTLPGNYFVNVYVINASGCHASAVRVVHVSPRPTASFTWTPAGACNPPASITFTSTSTGTGPMTYAWAFGDGGSGVGSPVPHSYTAIGSYNVKMVVTDANGCPDSVTLGPIHIDTIHAAFTGPESICVYTPVTFTDGSSPHSTQTWNFGEGSSTSPAVNGTHTYTTPGPHTVTLTISNPPCTTTVTHTINILPGPIADFTTNPANPCPAPQTITYTGTGPAGTIYSWVFQGGGTATGNPSVATYTTNGIKTVKMIVVDPITGCRDTVTKKDTIYDLVFTADATPDSGCAPLSVHFDTHAYTHIPTGLLTTYPFPVTSYTWDFGDGAAPGSGSSPVHIYAAAGVYTATVTAITANGCPVSATVRIWVGVPPVVTFSATPTHTCYSDHTPILFIPIVTSGPVDVYMWSFGDGVTSTTTSSAVHSYTLPGIFSVTVTPYYHGCMGPPFSIADYIKIDSPKAIINDTILCSPATRVSFHDISMGDDTHVWLFGDGATSTLTNVIHDYPALGTYTVTLATYNVNSGCRDTAKKVLNLVHPMPDFTASTTNICRGESITFTSIVAGGTPVNYYWYIDWAPTAIFTSPVMTHNFSSPSDTGFHTISLVIRNVNGCLDTVTRNNYIFVSGAIVNFTATPLSGCAPLTTTFTSAVTAVSGTSIFTYFWRFYDGTTSSSTPSITHTYIAAGSYDVSLVITDSHGCVDSMKQYGFIQVYHPTASFTVSNPHPCIGVSTSFNSTSASSGGIATYTWDFGDGSPFGSGSSPTHAYTNAGTYDVTLTVTDMHGCTDVHAAPAFIHVTKPNAAFLMSDSISVCPPLTVNFTNASTGATAYSWAFGDGVTSVLASPHNLYLSPALYTVQLVVTDTYGCTDTATHQVNIFGYAGAFTYTTLQGCAPLAVHFTATLSNVPFITWDFSDGTTSSASYTDTITHVYVTPGAYVPKLLLSDNTGCQNSSIGIDTIKVDAVTAKFTTMPHPVCVGMPFTFIDSTTFYWSPVTTWSWTYDGNTSSIAAPTYAFSAPGTYPVTLHVVNGWGCTGDDTHDVVVDPPPVVTASPDTAVCVGDPATLTGYGAITYTWASGATLSCTACNPTHATPLVETQYTVTGTDRNGCIDTASVTVRMRTHTISHAWGDTAVCYGVSVPLFDTGGTQYLWLPGDNLSSNLIPNPIATPPYTTVYAAIAKLAGCLPDTNYVTVTIYPLPTVDAGPDQRLLAGSVAQLHATGKDIATYLWSPPDDLSCMDCASPQASMSVTTTYNVDVFSEHGCKSSDTVRILLYCDNSQVFIPNAFTPNGDGQNDLFYPRGIGIKIIKTFRIYNRWGELLFERSNIDLNDANNAWDGGYKGGNPRPDVYVYIIEAVCFTGDDVFMKGDVTIIK